MPIQKLLSEGVRLGASDIHLSAGDSPWMRIDGRLVRSEVELITDEDIESTLHELLSPSMIQEAHSAHDYDCAVTIPSIGRVRLNVFRHMHGMGVAVRLIPGTVPRLRELGIPPVVAQFADLERGLVLVTGPTGSGKSTTVAALIDAINYSKALHIVTIEDPIEFVHESRNCLVHQREVGSSTGSFARALRAALREDPDVIVVGELRDLETIHLALTAAETGHLVMATVHSSSAAKTVDRIVDPFPAEQQAQIRSMFAESLQAIVSQTLYPRVAGGRIMAAEILIATPAVRTLIREGRSHQLLGVMQTSQGVGMQTLSSHIQELIRCGVVSKETGGKKLGGVVCSRHRGSGEVQ